MIIENHISKLLISFQGGYPCQNDELICENGGVCKKSEGGYAYCDCPVAYEGDTCQFSKCKLRIRMIARICQ